MTPPPPPPTSVSTPKSLKKQNIKLEDERYEFSAPQYYDFAGPSPGVLPSESWFEKVHSSQHDSPVEKEICHKTPPKGDEDSMMEIPPTVTQNRKRISNNSIDTRDSAIIAMDSTGNNDKGYPQSPMVIIEALSSENVFKQPDAISPTTKRGQTYQKLFQMKDKKKSDHHLNSTTTTSGGGEPKLGVLRTPDKIKIAKMKLSGPLLPTRSIKPLTIPVEFSFSERPAAATVRKTVNFEVPLQTNNVKKISKDPVSILKREKTLTVPQSPMLMTKLRQNKPPSIVTATMESQPKVAADVTNLKRPKVTIPVEPRLTTSLRRPIHENKEVISTSTFKATPIPTELLHGGPKGIPPKKKAPLTVPMTPKLHKTIPRQKSVDTYEVEPFIAKPMPKSVVQLPNRVIHKVTHPLPVKLPGDAIAEEKRKRLQEALQKEREAAEEARQFKAKPIPDYSSLNNTQKSSQVKVRALTKPEPFTFLSDLRGKHHQQEFQRKQQVEEKLKGKNDFIPRPIPHTAPFMTKKSTKPLTSVLPLHLHSAERAERRHEFDEHLKEKEATLTHLQEVQESQRRERELQEVRELRRQLVPIAQPVMHYKPVVVKPSDRPLTLPRSPPLSRNRKRNRDALNGSDDDDL